MPINNNNQLRKEIIDTLGISSRRLNQKLASLIETKLVTREQALWIIARESGIKITKYLTPSELEVLRNLSEMGLAKPKIYRKEEKEKQATSTKKPVVSTSRVNRLISTIEKNPIYRFLGIIAVILGILAFLGLRFTFFR